MDLLVRAAPQTLAVVAWGHIAAVDKHIGLREQLSDTGPGRPILELGEAVAGKADQRQVPLPPGDAITSARPAAWAIGSPPENVIPVTPG